MKKTKPKFAVSEIDGKDQFFISVDSSGINFMCLCFDAIPLSRFGNEKTWYLTIEQAIQWYIKELEHCRNSDRLEINLKALQDHKAAFERGELTEK